MLKPLLPLLFSSFFALSACASSPAPLKIAIPAEASSASSVKVDAPAPVPMQTLSDTSWEMSVPASFVREIASHPGDLSAFDKEHNTGLILQVVEYPDGLESASIALMVHLTRDGFEIGESKPVMFGGYRAIHFTASKDTGSGKSIFHSWMTVANGHLFGFACVSLPGSLPTSKKVCSDIAASVKINPLPAPVLPPVDPPKSEGKSIKMQK